MKASVHHMFLLLCKVFLLLLLTTTCKNEQERQAREHANQAKMLIIARDFVGSIAESQKALELKPGDEMAHVYWGEALIELEKYPEAMAVFEKGLKLNPQSNPLTLGCAWTAHQLKAYDESVRYYLQSLTLSPDFDVPYIQLNRVLDSIKANYQTSFPIHAESFRDLLEKNKNREFLKESDFFEELYAKYTSDELYTPHTTPATNVEKESCAEDNKPTTSHSQSNETTTQKTPRANDSKSGKLNKTDTSDLSEPYVVVDQMPSFPGGWEAMMQFIEKNFCLPEDCRQSCVVGRVTVRFIVQKNGSLDSIHVIRGVIPSCDKEALRVVRNMPLWEPGRHEGKAVDVYYTIPVKIP